MPEPVLLPAEFTIAVATSYLQRLMDRVEQGDDLLLNGAAVRRVDTAALQLLYVVQRALREQGRSLRWQAVSRSLYASSALLGLDDTLDIPDPG